MIEMYQVKAKKKYIEILSRSSNSLFCHSQSTTNPTKTYGDVKSKVSIFLS